MSKLRDHLPFAALFLIAVWLILAASCTNTQIQAAARLTLEAKLADVLIQSGDPGDVVISANLNTYEIDQVIKALDVYQEVRNRWQDTLDNPGTLPVNVLLLEDDYQALVVQYMVVQSIVGSHWDEYSPAQQMVLTSYQRRAVSLGTAVQEYLQGADRRQAISSALEIGLMLARIAAV